MSQSRFEEWLGEHKISEVECLVADMNGTARGKILPPKKFLKGNKSRGLRIPEEVFTLTINGRYTQDTKAVSDSAAERVISGLFGASSARGSAAGTGMPRPSATSAASCGDTLTSDASMRSRIAGTVSLLNSKRKPPTMCACSTSVWLS